MLLSKDYVGYLARHIVDRLVKGEFIDTKAKPAVTQTVDAGMIDELTLEDRINEEVRVILEAYSGRDARTGAQLPGDVQEGEDRAGAQVQGGAMRISAATSSTSWPTPWPILWPRSTRSSFIEDRNTIRQEARKALEESADGRNAHRRRRAPEDRLQRRIILEGSQEWDILYRKYYNEEVKKLGL